MTLWDRIERWREQPSHQDTMPLSKEAQAVVFTRSLCAGELEADLRELRELAVKWRRTVAKSSTLGEIGEAQAIAIDDCADELEQAIGAPPLRS